MENAAASNINMHKYKYTTFAVVFEAFIKKPSKMALKEWMDLCWLIDQGTKPNGENETILKHAQQFEAEACTSCLWLLFCAGTSKRERCRVQERLSVSVSFIDSTFHLWSKLMLLSQSSHYTESIHLITPHGLYQMFSRKCQKMTARSWYAGVLYLTLMCFFLTRDNRSEYCPWSLTRDNWERLKDIN